MLSVVGALLLCCATVSAILLVRWFNNPDVQAGFERTKDSLQYMVELRGEIHEKYPAENIEIKVSNGKVLMINLVNYETGEVPEESARAKAKEIATFARANYQGIDSIEYIQIVFTKHQKVGPVNTNMSRTFAFEVEELDSSGD